MEMLNNKEFLKTKLQIIQSIKSIYSQIICSFDNVSEEISSECLTTHLASVIEVLKEIKEHEKDKVNKQSIYN